MFDILAYLVERYYDFGTYPDQDTLSQQLIAAGFDTQDVNQALRWLSGLEATTFANRVSTGERRIQGDASLRQYAPAEQSKIDADSRGFLQFLESAGVLNGIQREIIVDRVMALDEVEVGLDELKLVVLLVLWKQGHALDALLLDELLVDRRAATHH